MKKANEILETAAATYLEKNKVYGDNYLRVGNAMKAFFPDGITLKSEHDHNRFHLFMLTIVKLSRYTVNWEKGHQDSIHDACVYAALLEAIDGDDHSEFKTGDKVKLADGIGVRKFKPGDKIKIASDGRKYSGKKGYVIEDLVNVVRVKLNTWGEMCFLSYLVIPDLEDDTAPQERRGG